jgi:hydrogenase nickel incorporation protein HypA/HybF
MHETSLMENLITIAEGALEGKKAKVKSVTLSVGKLSNALPAALSFAFKAMTQTGPLRGAELIMEEIPVKVRCENCGLEYEPDEFPYICPKCEETYYTITQGEDIYIESLNCQEL